MCNIVWGIVYCLTVTAPLTPHRKCYQLTKPEIDINVMENFTQYYTCTHVQKIQLFRQRRLKHNGVEEETVFKRVILARHYSTLVVLFSEGYHSPLCLTLLVSQLVSYCVSIFLCLNDQAHNGLIHFYKTDCYDVMPHALCMTS